MLFVPFFLPETEPIQYVSIEPDNDAFGAMQSSPRRKMNLTYISCLNEISVAMAGRLIVRGDVPEGNHQQLYP